MVLDLPPFLGVLTFISLSLDLELDLPILCFIYFTSLVFDSALGLTTFLSFDTDFFADFIGVDL